MSCPATRRRKSVIQIGGSRREVEAPGLKVIRRGKVSHVYWVCDEGERFVGYRPRTVRIHVDLTASDPAAIESTASQIEETCRREQQAMLAWADANVDDQERLKPRYDGTLGIGSRIACEKRCPGVIKDSSKLTSL